MQNNYLRKDPPSSQAGGNDLSVNNANLAQNSTTHQNKNDQRMYSRNGRNEMSTHPYGQNMETGHTPPKFENQNIRLGFEGGNTPCYSLDPLDKEQYTHLTGKENNSRDLCQPAFDPLRETSDKRSFHTEDVNDPYSRRNKVLAFVEKDLFIMNHYEPAPFRNRSHAIECIIPYHVFSVPADDLKYLGSDVKINLLNEFDKLKDNVERTLEKIHFRIPRRSMPVESDLQNGIEDVSRSIMDQASLIGNNDQDQPVNHEIPFDFNYKNNSGFTAQLLLFHEQRYFHSKIDKLERSFKKEKKMKKRLKKSEFFVRLKRPDNLYVYGPIYKLHIRCRNRYRI